MGTHPIFESDFDCLTEMSDNEVSTANGEYQMEVFTDSATMSGITGQKVEERIEGESDETDSSEDEGFNVIGETVITPTILKAQAKKEKPLIPNPEIDSLDDKPWQKPG